MPRTDISEFLELRILSNYGIGVGLMEVPYATPASLQCNEVNESGVDPDEIDPKRLAEPEAEGILEGHRTAH